MWKNKIVERGRPQMTTWRMRIACWITKVTHKLRICKAPYTLSVKQSDFTVWRHTWRKKWVNRAVLTGNSAGLRTVLSGRLSHRELCSLLRESHSFFILPADTYVSSNSFSRWAPLDTFLFKYHFLLHILHFLFFFLDNIMVDVASKQQTTPCFYPP
jgi:hypothetical protein